MLLLHEKSELLPESVGMNNSEIAQERDITVGSLNALAPADISMTHNFVLINKNLR